jgi:hypothetical protein
MSPLLLPFQLVLLMFAGWVNRHQLDVIEYLQEEIACSRSAWVVVVYVSPTRNAADSPEKRCGPQLFDPAAYVSTTDGAEAFRGMVGVC